MYERILVATDGSEAASAAGETAVLLAREFGADVHALSVIEVGSTPVVTEDVHDELEHRGVAAVAEIDDRGTTAGVDVTTALLERDDIVGAVVDYATDEGVDLVVMGTRGRSGLGRFAFGSVAERTVRLSPIPVMTVRQGVQVDPSFDSVLVPTDGSGGARAAIAHATELALSTGASLHVVHVVDVTAVAGDAPAAPVFEALEDAGKRTVDAAVSHASGAGVEAIQSSVLSGRPSRAIREYAETGDVDVIVMGARGRGGLARRLLGSVTERVVRHADAPVVTVRPPEDE